MSFKTLDLQFSHGQSRLCLSEDYSRLRTNIVELGLNVDGIVIADIKVANIYQRVIEAALSPSRLKWVYLEKGEAGKDFSGYQQLVEKVDALSPTRKTTIYALGGGVTGDMAGFLAATMLRGLPWVQLPTSLLAMVDASVGGKVGVNTDKGKNRVGAFYQPPLVYMAMNTLKTLPLEEMRSGVGEMVKHAIIRDKTGFELLESSVAAFLDYDPLVINELVSRSVSVKAAIVQEDEREEGIRALLNFGHTVGHAIERVMGYGELRHGECVGIGILAELFWTCQEFSASDELIRRTQALLDAYGLPSGVPSHHISSLISASHYDKKIENDIIKMTRVRSLGQSTVYPYQVHSLSRLFDYFLEFK